MTDVVVVGCAETKIEVASGRSAYDLAGEAMAGALADAGIEKAEIDGFVVTNCMSEAGNPFWSNIVADYLGLEHNPGIHELTVFCAALTGASLGFLWFNAPPAEVFMGDVGALGIGGAIGAVAVMIKYAAVALIPVFFIVAATHRRWSVLLGAAFPMIALGLWVWCSGRLYGSSQLGQAQGFLSRFGGEGIRTLAERSLTSLAILAATLPRDVQQG